MTAHHYGTQEVNRGAVQPGMLVNEECTLQVCFVYQNLH